MDHPLLVHAYLAIPGDSVHQRLHLAVPPSTPVSDLLALAGLASSTYARITTDRGRYLAPDATLGDVSSQYGQFSSGTTVSTAPPVFLQVVGRLCGGKGGFGSQLRASGGRMSSKRTTNNDMSRDLSNRRLKTIKEAKKMTKILERVAHLEDEKEERLSKKIADGLKAGELLEGKRRRFDDAAYEAEHSSVMDAMRKSTEKGTYFVFLIILAM
ncbi:telomere stability and silencing-domain-containing protein [Blastocladiella britannica]|nr:telomere stability and silencing-domain-containing protein [Blastocladiella britannica]